MARYTRRHRYEVPAEKYLLSVFVIVPLARFDILSEFGVTVSAIFILPPFSTGITAGSRARTETLI
jgi:hypothetical protein